MKKFLWIGLACAIGAFAALRIDHLLERKKDLAPGESLFSREDLLNMKPVGVTESIAAPADFRAAAKKIRPSVVSIESVVTMRSWFDEEYQQSGAGSGVILSSNGYIVTNNHVVTNGGRAAAEKISVHLSGGKVVPAKLIGRDPNADLAVLKVDAPNLRPAELGTSANLEVGQWVLAAGNPLNLEDTVSVGVVSNLGRTLPVPGTVLINAIQTDAAINPGNSGGALVDDQGRLIGINTAIASGTGESIGIGFAIPIDRAKKIIDDIIKYGQVRYGQLGVAVDNRNSLDNPAVREAYQNEFGMAPPSSGLIVRRVNAGSAAETAGVKQWSVILELDGTPMKSQIDLAKVMLDKRVGDKVTVKFWADGQISQKTVTLTDLTNL